MSVDQPAALAAATDLLRAETSVAGLIGRTARTFVEIFDAPACTISRVIGDLLVDLMQHQKSGKADRLGHGYLISDYPLTRAVIEERRPYTVFQGDPEADPSEVRLLKELGYDSLLMVAIETDDGAWGLVEVYGEKGRRFEDEDVRVAELLADEVGQMLRQLERPA
ncbi:MAG: GAF domain-containing protein [Actinobacteria bacterium]|nr:MAG: GAF domain-containing protein [Actinomycetota bacterium]